MKNASSLRQIGIYGLLLHLLIVLIFSTNVIVMGMSGHGGGYGGDNTAGPDHGGYGIIEVIQIRL